MSRYLTDDGDVRTVMVENAVRTSYHKRDIIVCHTPTERILVVSNASSSVSGGSMEGRRCASMVLPAPGGTVITHVSLCQTIYLVVWLKSEILLDFSLSMV
jgi:hypothetical protein